MSTDADLWRDKSFLGGFKGKESAQGSEKAWKDTADWLKEKPTDKSRAQTVFTCLQFYVTPWYVLTLDKTRDGKDVNKKGSVTEDIIARLPKHAGDFDQSTPLEKQNEKKREGDLARVNWSMVNRIGLMTLEMNGKSAISTKGWVINHGGTPTQIAEMDVSDLTARGYPEETTRILISQCEVFADEEEYWGDKDFANLVSMKY